MLRDTHKGMETMSMVSSAVKDERWGDADRGLHELHNLITSLMRQVGEKQRAAVSQKANDTRRA